MYSIQNELEKNQCRIGVLIMENVNNAASQEFTEAKTALEKMLREKYACASRAELKTLHPIDSYVAYYKKFGYTYHVLAQLESIVKGKSIPSVLPLVEAMFMAELKNMLLTAGHDADKAAFPISLKKCTGQESFVTMTGREVTTVAKDCMITDMKGILSAILRGPDQRTAIHKGTKKVLYTVYGLPDIQDELVYDHLSDIEHYIKLCSPDAVTTLKQIY
jgi:DNA/RNA-binding domain of Phe-tRNA-synthetase-like protein